MTRFRHQYLLTESDSPGWLPDSFGYHGTVAGYAIHASETLPVTIEHDDSAVAAILGDIFDPTAPSASNSDIMVTLLSCDGPDELFERLQGYSGRYIVLYNDTDFKALISDAGCLRRVLFTDDTTTITSSPQLFLESFGLDHEMGAEVARFVESGRLENNDYAWVGTQTIDRRLTSLSPNHYLDLNASTPRRRPLSPTGITNRQSAVEFVAETLAGGLAAIRYRYDICFPLTAGWDSRLLLATTEIDDSISFFTFLTNIPPSHPDVYISYQLAECLDIPYKTIRPRTFQQDFVERIREDYVNPRMNNKVRNIQYHYENASEGTAVLTGNVGEIIRAYYETPGDITPRRLSELYHYPNSEFARSELAAWLEDARPYANRTGIDLLDLFYWEQRIGNWGSRWPYEQDIAIREFTPFNHYNLLLCGLSIPREERGPSNSVFFEEVVAHSRPALNDFPINPPASMKERLKNDLKTAARDSQAFYWLKTAYEKYR